MELAALWDVDGAGDDILTRQFLPVDYRSAANVAAELTSCLYFYIILLFFFFNANFPSPLITREFALVLRQPRTTLFVRKISEFQD